jgi:hypothetical protein
MLINGISADRLHPLVIGLPTLCMVDVKGEVGIDLLNRIEESEYYIASIVGAARSEKQVVQQRTRGRVDHPDDQFVTEHWSQERRHWCDRSLYVWT